MPMASCRSLMVLGGATLAWLNTPAQAQTRMEILETPAARTEQESAPDTAQATLLFADSAKRHWKARLDAGYHTSPLHPYFRDEYRVIQDVRRLLLFIDPLALPELASLPEMFAIASAMPQSRQTQVIGAAVAGSVANQVSEMVSRRLRRSRMKFLQWHLEKVMVRTGLRGFEARVYSGMNMRGLAIWGPVRGLSYSYHDTKTYRHEGLSYWPSPHLGWHYGWLNGAPIYGPRFASPLGHLSVSYESGNRMLLSGFEFRRQMKVIIRILYVNFLAIKHADFWRSEVMLRW